MNDERRKTLETLLELAAGEDPAACWDPARATALLRGQATRAELEELGASEELLREIFAGEGER
ncbi:MAG: hypothetical protein ACRD2J_02830 [Thermoanaerobaculia bacterium]